MRKRSSVGDGIALPGEAEALAEALLELVARRLGKRVAHLPEAALERLPLVGAGEREIGGALGTGRSAARRRRGSSAVAASRQVVERRRRAELAGRTELRHAGAGAVPGRTRSSERASARSASAKQAILARWRAWPGLRGSSRESSWRRGRNARSRGRRAGSAARGSSWWTGRPAGTWSAARAGSRRRSPRARWTP